MPNSHPHFIHWFRDSAPYIHAHRNKTFVIYFSGEMMTGEDEKLIHDFTLLKSLGIRLVLVYGIQSQINQRLKQLNIDADDYQQRGITNEAVLQCIKETAGLVRVEIEALLSMGLANSPMAGAKIKVCSGNFVIAKPIGIIDGIDYQQTGTVRRIESQAIQQQLEQDNVILIAPIGYSPSGEIFNLTAEHIAGDIAVALQAEKLILLTEQCYYSQQQLIQQMTIAEAKQLLPQLNKIQTDLLNIAIHSCQQGISRVHLINSHIDGALLLELFTRDGAGTLITAHSFEITRPASLNDIAGILELIKPLEQQGILVDRSVEKLEMAIEDYIIIERDGLVIGCIALHRIDQQPWAEIACLAIHPDYRKSARGQHLLEHLIKKARNQQIHTLFVLTTQAIHWFVEHGFKTGCLDDLPKQRQAFYNFKRNSKVLYKHL